VCVCVCVCVCVARLSPRAARALRASRAFLTRSLCILSNRVRTWGKEEEEEEQEEEKEKEEQEEEEEGHF